jgi:hypothetical protein
MHRGARAFIVLVSLTSALVVLPPVASEAATRKVSIRLSAGTIRSDRLAKVSGSVSPSTHGGTVWLYRYEHGWHRVKSTVLGSHSTYAISFAPPRAGTFDYRVVWHHVPSRSVRLTVRKAPSVWSSCRKRGSDWEPDFPIDSVIRTNAYLYVKSIFATNGKTYPFTLTSIAYSTGVGGAAWNCWIHLEIPVGHGPNQVEPLPATFDLSQVRVRDTHGHVITGWSDTLDSKHVDVVGVGIEEYGGDNGRPGTNTLRLRTLSSLS